MEFNIRPPVDGLLATSDVYTDGALRGLITCSRSAGLAFVATNGAEPTWERDGTDGEQYPTTLRVELRPFAKMLLCALPPVVIHTDNEQVVDGWSLGKARSCASNRDGADLWRLFWALIVDVGEGVEIRKAKAHVSFAKVRPVEMTRQG